MINETEKEYDRPIDIVEFLNGDVVEVIDNVAEEIKFRLMDMTVRAYNYILALTDFDPEEVKEMLCDSITFSLAEFEEYLEVS